MKVPCKLCGAEVLPATAERTGGVCMPCFKNPKRNEPSEIVQKARATPARCLSRFKVTREGPALEDAPLGPQVAVFALQCGCGCPQGEILGHGEDQAALLAPFGFRCPQCNTTTEMFDPRADGYDAEIDAGSGRAGKGQRIPFLCSGCGKDALSPVVSLEYSQEDEETDDWPELAERPQDFFTWFVLYGHCPACGQLSRLADYECA
jgi:hypothetical protein